MYNSSVAPAAVLAILLFAGGGLPASVPAAAQPITDTLFTWRGYSRISTAHVAIYPADPKEEERPHTVVLTERAENRGPSTVDDMRFLADAIGREFGVDPALVTWVVRWGAYSFKGARGDKEVLLRATFRRTGSGRLGSPYWRVITRNDLLELTDRRWRDER